MALIFDTESNGFLENATKVHCLVIKDTEKDITLPFPYEKQGVDYGGVLLGVGETIVGHNCIKHDLPLLTKLVPGFTYDESKVIDTLVCSRLIWTNLYDLDAKLVQQQRLPVKLQGSHSLKAWGYRLGTPKGDYAEEYKERMADDYEPGDEWKECSPEMVSYCTQDTEVTAALYALILKKAYSPEALKLEHEVAFICAKMERTGFPFDVKKAAALYAEIAQKRDEIRRLMDETFEPEVISGRTHKTSGKPLADIVTPFNPSSRQHIAKRLIDKYQWKPQEYTPGGQAKIDETILGSLEYPEAKMLAEYFTLEKRVGQIAEGDNAWMKLERNGKLHGGYNTNGAVTGRCTHQTPNMAQVPAVRSIYGPQCRELFRVPPRFSLVGADLSGIEARMLAHFMYPYDQGTYATAVISGNSKEGTDIHSVNQRAAGLPTRDAAKTFFYAFLYGAGDEKIGSIVGGGAKDGKRLKKAFLDATPALKKLRDQVSTDAKQGFLKGLDGRNIQVRSAHAALNSLLQCAGALISKQWMVEVIKAADAKGWVWKEDWTGDYALCVYVHDELGVGVREGLEHEFGQMMLDAALKAGEYFNVSLPIGAEYKTGKNWSETH